MIRSMLTSLGLLAGVVWGTHTVAGWPAVVAAVCGLVLTISLVTACVGAMVLGVLRQAGTETGGMLQQMVAALNRAARAGHGTRPDGETLQ